MKINMLALQVFSLLIIFQVIALDFFEKAPKISPEKEALYHNLAELEKHKRAINLLHEENMHAIVDENVKNKLQKEHNQKIEDISKQIEKQKQTIANTYKEEFLWNTAKIIGTVALVGLFAYNTFATHTASIAPVLLKKEESITQPKSSEREPTSESILKKIPQSENIPTSVKKLTPQEKVVYKLRYKNYSMWAGWITSTTAVSLLALGPVAWPVDLALFGIAVLSAEKSLYYKRKLDETVNN